MAFISQVHMKPTVQLESRVRDLESVTCCTLFLLIENQIVRRRQGIKRKGGKRPKNRKWKPARLVLQRDGEDHRKTLAKKVLEWRTEPS